MLCAALVLGSQSALGFVATSTAPATPVVGRTAAASPSMILGFGKKTKEIGTADLTGKVPCLRLSHNARVARIIQSPVSL